MWPFTKNISFKESGFYKGLSDFHCHLLPGVDDGVQDMEISLRILARFEQLGVEKVWFTPHVMEDVPNTTQGLQKRFEELKAEYHGEISLNLAAEYMMDNLFEERLSSGDLLPIGNQKNSLLVETSYFNPPMRLKDILMEIKQQGFYPILAHPERYQYMGEKEYKELKKIGIKFQLNYPSLAGQYGNYVKRKAVYLLKNGYYNLLGSDTHREGAFVRTTEVKLDQKIFKKMSEIDIKGM